MKLQTILCPLTMTFVAFGFFACSGDSKVIEIAEATDSENKELDHDIVDSIKTEDDLKACLKKNEGDSIWVIKDSTTYVCKDGKWQKRTKEAETSSDIPVYGSEDDMPNCSKNRQGNLVISQADAHICNDGAWQDLGTAYATSDSLPNCTKKQKNKSAFIIEDSLALYCNGEKWQESESTTKIIEEAKTESSSSSSDEATNDNSSSSSEEKDPSSSSQEEENPESSADTSVTATNGTLTDPRDGKVYKTVKIGNQVWFAENLNYDDNNSVCPMEDAANCEKYGRLYIFQQGLLSRSSLADVCPDGWRLPDSLDWAELIGYVATHNEGEPIGVSLKATTDWYSLGDTVVIKVEGPSSIGDEDSTRIGATKGTDRFGFTALPAGSCWESGCYIGDDTRFFMTSPGQSAGFKLAFDKDELIYDESAYYGYISVRCIQNQFVEIDSIPPSIEIDTLVWMEENLTYQGSDRFTYSQSLDACPQGWRLPTWEEFAAAVKSKKMSFPADTVSEFFASSGYYLGFAVSCAADSCTTSFRSSSTTKAIRCVNKQTVPANSSPSSKDPAKEETVE